MKPSSCSFGPAKMETRCNGWVASLLLMFLIGHSVVGYAEKAPEVVIKSKRNPGRELVLGAFKKSISREIDLGEDWDGVLELRGLQSSSEYSVEMQYETSMTIQDEGAHFDLTNWKHYQSEWRPLKATSSTQFVIDELLVENSHKFPFASKDEFLAAVKKLAASRNNGSKWINLTKTCKGPLDYPCGVGVSKVTLQIYEGPAKNRTLIQKIVMIPPMGC